MKTKLIGLLILVAVAIVAVAYVGVTQSRQVTEISGFVGGEKIGLLEDEEVQEILHEHYHLSMDYAKAGSIDMVTEDAGDRNFLFPSNQTALEIYEDQNGASKKARSFSIRQSCFTPAMLSQKHSSARALRARMTVFTVWIWPSWPRSLKKEKPGSTSACHSFMGAWR